MPLAHCSLDKVLPERKIEEYSRTILAERGVRLGDQLIISPLYGHKKVFSLKRTKFQFLSLKKRNEVKIPSEEQEDFQDPQDPQDPQLPQFKKYQREIDQDQEEDRAIEGTRFYLDVLGIQEMFFELILCMDDHFPKDQERGRFLLRSCCLHPFRINGNLSFEAFLERGDKVDIGYNRLSFEKNREEGSTSLLGEEAILTEKILQSDLNLLLCGETGTGKSHLAKLIHQKSGRLGTFVHINLSSFSPTLLESELFGHVKGAFTGAFQEKKGAFLEAQNGTLFLDEIDSLPKSIQTKLLLFLDSKEVRPVGGTRTKSCHTRLIFAAGRDLMQLVQTGEMREDFYYRLIAGLKINLKPLRERPQQIKILCEDFALKENVLISPRLIDFYQTLPWKGNIRQLFSHLRKKMILSQGSKIDYGIEEDELITQSNASYDSGYFNPLVYESPLPLEEMKLNYALKIYYHCQESILKTSKVLNISPNTMREFLRKKKILKDMSKKEIKHS